MSIITQKKKNYDNLHTKLIMNCIGTGEDLFEYNLYNLIHNYTRQNNNHFKLEFLIDGVFNTKKGIDYLNDILSRFYVSFENDNISNINTKVVRTKDTTIKAKHFGNLKSLGKEVYVPNVYNDDFVFWSIKLWVESRIRQGASFIAYTTIEDYAITHFLDMAKDFSTLKAKCRNIWYWYDARDWKQSIKYEKKPKDEVMATRQENGKLTALKREQETIAKIKSALAYIEHKGEKRTAKNISDISGLHRNTIAKYKYIWNKEYIAKMHNSLKDY